MKLNVAFWGLIVLIFLSCTAKKSISSSKKNITDAIQSAIVDFLHSNKNIAEKDSVFSVYIEDISTDVLGIGISAERDKVSLFTKNEIDYDYRFFPARFYEYQEKLFYWKDSTVNVSNEIIKKLYEMNRVDTTIYQKLFPQRTIDEKQVVVHYYFCKKDLTRYSKKRTSITNKNYKIPKINCNL